MVWFDPSSSKALAMGEVDDLEEKHGSVFLSVKSLSGTEISKRPRATCSTIFDGESLSR